jgi:hypothetical protein
MITDTGWVRARRSWIILASISKIPADDYAAVMLTRWRLLPHSTAFIIRSTTWRQQTQFRHLSSSAMRSNYRHPVLTAASLAIAGPDGITTSCRSLEPAYALADRSDTDAWSARQVFDIPMAIP